MLRYLYPPTSTPRLANHNGLVHGSSKRYCVTYLVERSILVWARQETVAIGNTLQGRRSSKLRKPRTPIRAKRFPPTREETTLIEHCCPLDAFSLEQFLVVEPVREAP